jgi:hypothetical protein
MVATDVLRLPLAVKALELPMQTLAATLLMFAFVTRYLEVKAVEPGSVQHGANEAAV